MRRVDLVRGLQGTSFDQNSCERVSLHAAPRRDALLAVCERPHEKRKHSKGRVVTQRWRTLRLFWVEFRPTERRAVGASAATGATLVDAHVSLALNIPGLEAGKLDFLKHHASAHALVWSPGDALATLVGLGANGTALVAPAFGGDGWAPRSTPLLFRGEAVGAADAAPLPLPECGGLLLTLAPVGATGAFLVALLRPRPPYFRRVDLPWTGRGDAAAATWMFRGETSRRRRGCDLEIQSRPAHASGTRLWLRALRSRASPRRASPRSARRTPPSRASRTSPPARSSLPTPSTAVARRTSPSRSTRCFAWPSPAATETQRSAAPTRHGCPRSRPSLRRAPTHPARRTASVATREP